MSSTMSVAEDKFEDVYVKDMVNQYCGKQFEARVIRFTYSKLDSYNKSKDVDFRKKLAKELKRARRFLKYGMKQKVKLVRRMAKKRFRSMTDMDKIWLAQKYKSRGYQPDVCNRFLTELGDKAERQGASMDAIDETVEKIQGRETDEQRRARLEKEKKERKEEEKRRREEEEKQNKEFAEELVKAGVTMAVVNEASQNMKVEYDLSGNDYAKKREEQRAKDRGRVDDRFEGRQIGYYEETVTSEN